MRHAFLSFVQKQALLPKASRDVALAVALMAAFSLLAMEYAVLPRLSESGRVDADEWQKDSDVVNSNYWKKNPNSSKPGEDWVWRSAAYRVPARRERSRRILVLGDSFVWGSGGIPNMNNLSWRQLERELRRRGYGDVEVIAAGRSGASTHREFNALPVVLDRYRPDLIVWLYVTNDADEGIVKHFDQKAIEGDQVYRFHLDLAGTDVFPRTNRQLAALRKRKLEATMPPDEVGYEYSQWELEILKGENLRRYELTLAKIGAWIRRNRTPLFFITAPNQPFSAIFSPRYAVVEPLFEKEGIPFYNILDEFVSRYPDAAAELEQWRASPTDGHPGHKACRFHAEKIADILEGEYTDYLGRKSGPFLPHPWVNDWIPEDMEVKGRSRIHLEFRYPVSSGMMPRMPIGSPYVQLSFRDPVPIGRISISGPALESARIFLSGEDPAKLFESGAVVGLHELEGRRVEWSLAEYPWKHCVDAIRVQARFGGPDRTLRIEFR